MIDELSRASVYRYNIASNQKLPVPDKNFIYIRIFEMQSNWE